MTNENEAADDSSPRPSVTDIQQWLVNQLTEELNVDQDKIQIDQPVQSYGVDSMQVVTIIANLEDWLRIRFESNPLEDYPTIESLAEFVADPVNGPPSTS